MKVAQTRPNAFTVTATSQELSALVAAARMMLEAIEGDPKTPPETVELLRRVLADYDQALARLPEPGGA